MNSGFIASGYDPRDIEIEAQSMKLPESYSYDSFIHKVKDQGYTSKCVPYSISYALELINECNGKSVKVDIDKIYDMRENNGDGMMIRNALSILKHNECGCDKISLYGKLTTEKSIKYSLVANGPCIIALPVRSSDTHFWKGNQDMGGHAICCIGYNEYGLILLNSWGAIWGDCGQCILPYDEINTIIECWGIIA